MLLIMLLAKLINFFALFYVTLKSLYYYIHAVLNDGKSYSSFFFFLSAIKPYASSLPFLSFNPFV